MVQCILCHFVINKRKVLLDQLKEGLKTLGVLDEIIKHPEVLAPMFIWVEKSLDPTFIKNKLIFPPFEGEHVVKHMLLHFIDESSELGTWYILSLTFTTLLTVLVWYIMLSEYHIFLSLVREQKYNTHK